MTAAPLPDGLVAIVKRDCPTCRLVAPVLADLADGVLPLTVYSQDDPTFPDGVKVVDDTELEVSFALELETVPTLLHVDGGEIVARTEGWLRPEWEALTGRAPLGAGLPEYRPGCGSRTVDPDVAAARSDAAGAARLGSRRVDLGEHEDDVEAAFDRGLDRRPARRAAHPGARGRACWTGTTRDPADDRRRRAARPRRLHRREGRHQRGDGRLPARVPARGARRGRGGVHRRVQHPRPARDDHASSAR